MASSNLCTICLENLLNNNDSVTTVLKRGLSTLIERSKENNDDKWLNWVDKENFKFHSNCRKRYAKQRSKKILGESVPSTQFLHCTPSNSLLLSSSASCTDVHMQDISESVHQFQFEKLCIFCELVVAVGKPNSRTVAREDLKSRILDHSAKLNDEASKAIFDRLKNIKSIIGVKARYHKECLNKFFYVPTGNPLGSYKIKDLETAFDAVCSFIENSGNRQFQLSELNNIMGKYQMATKTLIKKLRETYNNDIDIFQQVGKQPIISYKTNDVYRSCTRWRESASISEIEKEKILETAAKIIHADIKSKNYDVDNYPASKNFLDNIYEDIPDSLKIFLKNLITSDNRNNQQDINFKRDNIAHTIISAVRPRSFISSLQLALGLYIYRKSGSKLIIDMLSKLGYCSSYYDIQLFEASVIMDPPKIQIDDVFIQHVFDNTDHNVKTLDGHEPFHCLGGIAVYTPGYGVSYDGKIKKLKKMPQSSELAAINTIDVIPYTTGNIINGLDEITFANVSSLKLGDSSSLPFTYSAYLWANSAYLAGSHNIPQIPSWKGFMEVISSESVSYYVSEIKCLPFITQPPSHMTTLNTAINFSKDDCKQSKQQFTFVTFDQPLYLKARSIVATCEDKSLKNVVIRLGGFHLMMSYLGAIGFIMDGSGLEDLWEVVYTSGSVKKMLTGHAYARSVRAHILTYTALGIIICRSVEETGSHYQFLEGFLEKWDSQPPTIGDCNFESHIKNMTNDFSNILSANKSMGPTAKLWVQYFECITVALQFLEAERLGDWKLHLQSIQKMLPIFHASGHHAYAKSAQIYLQDMVQLEYEMDHEEYRKFTTEGYFTIRRTDKAFSGIAPDMTIEQTLNRLFGCDLKHGRGVTPGVIARYLDSMPSVFPIMSCLEDYTSVSSSTSEQHVDLSAGRMKRDATDLSKFVFWLQEHDPFKKRDYLMSLSTGVIGEADINCHKAKELGYQGMLTMVDKNVSKVSLSYTYKVKSLVNAKAVKKSQLGKVFTVNSVLLFQKISNVFLTNPEVKKEAFKYELSPFPLSLFDKNGAMRKTVKSELYDCMSSTEPRVINLAALTYVVDGGFLLHKIVWPHGSITYKQICELYLKYIRSQYKENCHIIFDGYDNEHFGVKSYERYRRQQKSIGADVHFTEDMVIQLRQRAFLANIMNKQKFVEMLSNYLKRAGINVQVAQEDADYLIVKTAIDLSADSSSTIAVAGTDIDLLVLLIGLTPTDREIFFRKCGSARTRDSWYTTKDNVDLKSFILFAHAFAGCDTTNAMYGKGKKILLKVLKQHIELQNNVQIFYNNNIVTDDLYPVAEKLIFKLYSASPNVSDLADLRCKRFESSGSAETSDIKLSQLPPTKGALTEHIKRVYYQIQVWLGNNLRPELWGWKRQTTMMAPIMTGDEPAPESMMSLIACGCNKNCDTSRCRCRKAGLHCTELCKMCKGESCNNADPNQKIFDAVNDIDNVDNNEESEDDD